MFYKVVRNFNRPVHLPAQRCANANTLIFLNYVNAMNQVQEKVAAVIHKNDRSDVAAGKSKSHGRRRLPMSERLS